MAEQHTEKKSSEKAKEPRTTKAATAPPRHVVTSDQDGTTPHEGRARVPAEELNPDDFE